MSKNIKDPLELSNKGVCLGKRMYSLVTREIFDKMRRLKLITSAPQKALSRKYKDKPDRL